jgi:hypothetical protein
MFIIKADIKEENAFIINFNNNIKIYIKIYIKY